MTADATPRTHAVRLRRLQDEVATAADQRDKEWHAAVQHFAKERAAIQSRSEEQLTRAENEAKAGVAAAKATQKELRTRKANLQKKQSQVRATLEKTLEDLKVGVGIEWTAPASSKPQIRASDHDQAMLVFKEHKRELDGVLDDVQEAIEVEATSRHQLDTARSDARAAKRRAADGLEQAKSTLSRKQIQHDQRVRDHEDWLSDRAAKQHAWTIGVTIRGALLTAPLLGVLWAYHYGHLRPLGQALVLALWFAIAAPIGYYGMKRAPGAIGKRREAAKAIQQRLQAHEDAMVAWPGEEDRLQRRVREAQTSLDTVCSDGIKALDHAEGALKAAEAALKDARGKADGRLSDLLPRYALIEASVNALLEAETKAKVAACNATIETIRAKAQGETKRIGEKTDRAMAQLHIELEESLDVTREAWREKCMEWDTAIDAVHAYLLEIHPGWGPETVGSASRHQVPTMVGVGSRQVNADALETVRTEAGTITGCPAFSAEVPFTLLVPEELSLCVSTNGPADTPHVEVLSMVAMRLLQGLPPSTVRLAIMDPLGLGDNFATFMHLADHDEAFVSNRIWTEKRHIEQQLGNIIEHIEMVIQKYLRGQYESIEQYNREAGEVAEPYLFVIVADFPRRFSEQAAEDLMRIIGSGPRCGVYVLLAHDESQEMPRGFDAGMIDENCQRFAFDDEAWHVWDAKGLDLLWTPDRLPAPDTMARYLDAVGEAATSQNQVQVPFAFIRPEPEAVWSMDSGMGLEISIGRAGATKRQKLRLGAGTSQHVLIAGKTGSGKSTLLHALITNAALQYSPDQLQLYLVDFKKGVEFKTYADHRLPHAHVIGIESEREFGLSVLQHLDGELKRRGELFRRESVQNLAAFRDACPDTVMPRMLLVIDEFQELFVEDDNVARTAQTLLDRIVRQGRAFGMHVVLGSQTVAGSMALARTTMDQMAVRIALQSSESDARAIFADDNAAARNLRRPGEAIYNDHAGKVEGNNPFQVAWLPEEEHEKLLAETTAAREERGSSGIQPQIVFEGHKASDIEDHELLRRFAAKGEPLPGSDGSAIRVWLGDAVAIEPPTSILLARHPGANVLLISHDAEAVGGLLQAATYAIAAQMPRYEDGDQAQIHLVDAASRSDEETLSIASLANSLAGAGVESVSRRDLAALLQRLAAEVERRTEGDMHGAPPHVLVLNGIHRLRDLRDGDMPYTSRTDRPPSPKALLETILADGPEVGVHTIVASDSLKNALRGLDRRSIREFDHRILTQLNASESSQLVDSPVASRLGPHRAILHNDEENIMVKFRPYRPTEGDFQEHMHAALVRRNRRPTAATLEATVEDE